MSARVSRRWTLPLRRWLLLALAVGFVVPVFTTAFVAFHVIGIDRESGPDPAEMLGENGSRWTEPGWQSLATEELAEDGTEFILFENGQEVYRSAEEPLAGANGETREQSVETVAMTADGVERVAYIYSDQPDWTESNSRFAMPIAAVASLLVTLGGIAWFLGRTVVQPLGTTSAAARRMAKGHLDIELQPSRVWEVADVNETFEAMSAGLRESLESQSRLEQERRFLISSVAHDLRTPLFSLRGYLEGLEQNVADTPEKRERYLSMAREKAGTLERMIADLSDYTRLEYLEQAPNQEPVDLVGLLKRLVDGLRPQAEVKKVQLTFDRGAGPCIVDADSHLLTRAVENLLDNALRHTPNGGAIQVRCQVTDQSVRFTVEDTGPGIPDQDLPHIFTPLFRGETSRNRRTGGSGLGLTIARRIMRAHGGDLTAENARGGGARFTGTLPVSLSADRSV